MIQFIKTTFSKLISVDTSDEFPIFSETLQFKRLRAELLSVRIEVTLAHFISMRLSVYLFGIGAVTFFIYLQHTICLVGTMRLGKIVALLFCL